jgi:hypothetical protein
VLVAGVVGYLYALSGLGDASGRRSASPPPIGVSSR